MRWDGTGDRSNFQHGQRVPLLYAAHNGLLISTVIFTNEVFFPPSRSHRQIATPGL
jgi:hypothetical protein